MKLGTVVSEYPFIKIKIRIKPIFSRICSVLFTVIHILIKTGIF